MSPGQMEWHGCTIDDKSVKVGGKQTVTTPDGYVFPLAYRNGLPYMEVRPYTDEEWETLPHVFMMRMEDWDPEVLDFDPTDEADWGATYTHIPVDGTARRLPVATATQSASGSWR